MAPAADIRDLLLHAEWLRRLATHLVRDGDAADVVQQTWLAALRSPPARHRPARPWLAEVLRNFARRTHRDGLTRRRYESSAGEAVVSSPAAAPSAESLVEAAEVQRRLAELVVALDEPYRSTILLRFYQGIEPTEIARTAGVPAGTVRWRVNEGVRRLREALDAREGVGDWRRALLPLSSAGAPAASAASTLKGGLLIMSTKAKLGIAAALAALAIGALTWNLRAGPARTSAFVPTADPSRRAPAGQASAGSAAQAGAAASGVVVTGLGSPPSATTSRPRATRPPPPRLVAVPTGSAPTPEPAPAEQRGSIDKDEIRRAMRRAIPALRDCYTRLLENQPRALGRLVFHFTITDDGNGGGRVSDASIRPRTADAGAPELIAPLAEQCMLNAIAATPFPPPKGGQVIVTYPFSFAPSGDMIPGATRPAPAP
jgi:RNA polymerase sigma-70 factor (ECF subfamily)